MIWTRSAACGREIARRIEAGATFVNGMVASGPRLPFGRIKKSGYGRKLGELGIREFVNSKMVWIGLARQARSGLKRPGCKPASPPLPRGRRRGRRAAVDAAREMSEGQATPRIDPRQARAEAT